MKNNKSESIIIIGGGLAGTEAAWQLAQKGHHVKLYEMRPQVATGAHQTDHLAEVVCSNSLGSKLSNRATGLLQAELKLLGCQLLEWAEECSVPAGQALAVDREKFSEYVTQNIENHSRIDLIREEYTAIPEEPCIIASGPLTSEALSKSILEFCESDALFFFDAISPIISTDSINRDIAFKASRYDKDDGEGDYINCPLNKEEYENFVSELLTAERIPLKSFEEAIRDGVKAGAHHFFEGCLPVELIAERGKESLAFGPMRPVGLRDPRTGRRPYAVLQLRQDNRAASLYNLVGFQTNLKFPEQERVFRMIPGLERAEFIRHGQMHRNTFLASPLILKPDLSSQKRSDLFFAGQITGVEGYMGNIATGCLAGLNLSKQINGDALLVLPETTILGALCQYITHASLKDFQPMKANFGILPALQSNKKIPKKEKGEKYAKRSLNDLKNYLSFNHAT